MQSVMLAPVSDDRVQLSHPCCLQILAGWVAESDSAVLVVVASAVRRLACSGHVKTAGGRSVPMPAAASIAWETLSAGGQSWLALCALMAAQGRHTGSNSVITNTQCNERS